MASFPLGIMFAARTRMAWNSAVSVRNHSSFKVLTILFFAVALWMGLFWLFMDGYHFLGSERLVDFRPPVLDITFAIFFLSLLVMLLFSNGIIAYGSLFKSEETAFLLTRPIPAWQVYLYRLSDAFMFSSWAFLFLAMPIVVALGVGEKAPWYYYPGAAALFGVFALLPAAAGGLLTLLVGRFLTRSPKRALIVLGVLVVIPAVLWGVGLADAWRVSMDEPGQGWVQGVVGKLALARSPLLPSTWASRAVLDLARGEVAEAGYRFLFLLSTALFVGMVAVHLARAFYTTAYHRTQAMRHRRKGRASVRFYRVIEGLVPWVSDDLRALIVKDVKSFLRDPVQWSQVLIFFGLLGVYFLNIRNFRYDTDSPFWKHLISLLNLVATSLTLSTFTSRFIYPLLSLEGRKFWVLGLLPINRRNILYSKFWFAFIGSLCVSGGLMGLSDLMLRMGWRVAVLHGIAVLVICGGLSALAVGVGALYPNLRETNPSKIVSGFGGTLNLVLSLLFVITVIVLMVGPYHLAQMQRGGEAFRAFQAGGDFLMRLMLPGSIAAVGVGFVAVAASLWLGVRAFERLEA